MPVITIEGPRIDLDKKRRLAQDLTNLASEAFALPKEAIVVILHEVAPECVSSGGELICDRSGPQDESPST